MDAYKILLVDDDPEDRMIMYDGLQELGAAAIVRFAEGGEAAFAVLNDGYSKGIIPRLVVLDLNIPKMNGTQILRVLKEDPRFKHIPVIIYSTSINPLEKERCLLLGAHSYIIKPVSFKEGVDTARLFLDLCDTAV